MSRDYLIQRLRDKWYFHSVYYSSALLSTFHFILPLLFDRSFSSFLSSSSFFTVLALSYLSRDLFTCFFLGPVLVQFIFSAVVYILFRSGIVVVSKFDA